MSWPIDPIAAVTHPDPYPYYAALVDESPLYFDSKLRMWIVSGPAAVRAVMAHSLCEVRPVSERIPHALQNTPAEIIFRHLIRTNDGAEQQKTKQRLSTLLASLAEKTAVAHARHRAADLWFAHESQGFHKALGAFQFDFSVHVLGQLLGFSNRILPTLALWIRDFVHCLSPRSRPEQIEAGIRAAGQLLDLFRTSLTRTPMREGWLAAYRQAMPDSDPETIDRVAANGIGLLSQAYEATAGLIANSCLALARRPGQDLPALIRDTLRRDPPVQNTRRFLAGDALIEGREMQKGDVILLVLAAANRENLQGLSFGSGAHRCPGESLASLLAVTALEHLLERHQDFASLTTHVHYRPSANTRIPLFHNSQGV